MAGRESYQLETPVTPQKQRRNSLVQLPSESSTGVAAWLQENISTGNISNIPSATPIREEVPPSEFSMLTKKEVIAVVQKRPHDKYDLLDLLRMKSKSETFYINFDMDTAKARFLVRHRSAACGFLDLPINERIELVKLSQNFVETLGLQESFLTIPAGMENLVGIAYRTFYAYIVVKKIEQYIEVFKKISSQHTLFSWPLIKRWKTRFWLNETLSYKSINIFLDSLRFNSSMNFATELSIMTRRDALLCSQRNDAKPLETVSDFVLHNWSAKQVIGVGSATFNEYSKDPADRWQLLNMMDKQTREWRREDSNLRCWLSIPLFFQFYIERRGRVHGLIRFPQGIPDFLCKAKKVGTRAIEGGVKSGFYITTSFDLLGSEWLSIDLISKRRRNSLSVSKVCRSAFFPGE